MNQLDFYVEFLQKDETSLRRTIDFFGMIREAKSASLDIDRIESDKSDDIVAEVDDTVFINYLTDVERAYFWNPSEQESQEYWDEWFSTPVEVRNSPQWLYTQWHLESMLDAFWNGDYDLIAIQEESNKYYLTFDPHGYPYGGTGCMVALLECFGNQVIGIDDGTGYIEYTPRTEFWQPKNSRSA
ncbi:hypothetical protein [Chamaesiphon sp. GL140_3_metabinner_50]|uniref:hypothetical protein n=1 Tax=Chamaesiphon sp. GL140_3_metabinner_50 TaxID=2970812 RepID=UPI0025EFCFAD|nr:hypothetical protein [Chamaesiphon sp. GL140_3_metabinner_50]